MSNPKKRSRRPFSREQMRARAMNRMLSLSEKTIHILSVTGQLTFFDPEKARSRKSRRRQMKNYERFQERFYREYRG